MKNYSVFEQIKVYSEVFSLNKTKGIQLFKEKNEKTSLLYKYVLRAYGEKEIYSLLGYESVHDPSYIKLKSRLLAKLKASMFFLDNSNNLFSNLGLEYYKLSKALFLHKISLSLNKRALSYETIEKDLHAAIKYEFPDIVLQLAMPLRDQYGYLTPNEKKFRALNQLIEENMKSFQLEELVLRTYSEISYAYLYKSEARNLLLKRFKEYFSRRKNFEGIHFRHKSSILNFQLEALFLELKDDFNGIISLGLNTLNEFDKKPYETFQVKYLIKIEIVKSCTLLKEYDEALYHLNDIISIYEKGHHNWFKMKSTEAFLKIIKKDFDSAYKIVFECSNQLKSKADSILKETWKIKEAYFHFIAELGLVSDEIKEQYPLKNFRLNKFLNDVPVFSKEKKGLNVSILIIQMLLYVQQKKYNNFIDRMDALSQYTYRYLRNDDTLRSNCFIKMLLKIPDARFHPVATKRHTEKLYKKLQETPPPIADQSTMVEIIPYEDLWEMVIQLLEKDR